MSSDAVAEATSNNPPKSQHRLHAIFQGVPGRIALAAACVIAATFAGMIWLLQTSLSEAGSRDRVAQMKLITGTLDSAMDQAGKFALALAETTARRGEIGAALAAGDRDALQRLSASAYDYLKRQAGIQIYGYHSKDIRYLLRMHKIEAFNDDISAFRPMVVAANRSRRAQTGVEIGIAGIGVRGVAVVHNGDDMVGTMEVGLDIRPILDLVKASTNADLAVVIVPSLTGVALDEKMPRFGDLALAVSTDDELFARLLKSGTVPPTRDLQIGQQRIDGRTFNTAVQPLVDFSGRLVGMTIALKDDPRSGARTRTELWVAALCGGIIAYVIFAVLLQATLARRRGA
ncbi:hypothetical protein MXD81_45250 [Microbacteriaceae bacterium K1510]|nr:hypothetical protein [Microbacteriaceae bacterium K1510]